MNKFHVDITKEEFDNFFKKYYHVEFTDELYEFLEQTEEMKEFWKRKNTDSKIQEYVYLIPLEKDYGILIYSSIDKKTNSSRGYGKDAFRLVPVDFNSFKPIRKSRKILRINSWKKNFVNAVDRIIHELGNDMKCQKCGKRMTLKGSKKTKSNFLGCSDWPNCRNNANIVIK